MFGALKISSEVLSKCTKKHQLRPELHGKHKRTRFLGFGDKCFQEKSAHSFMLVLLNLEADVNWRCLHLSQFWRWGSALSTGWNKRPQPWSGALQYSSYQQLRLRESCRTRRIWPPSLRLCKKRGEKEILVPRWEPLILNRKSKPSGFQEWTRASSSCSGSVSINVISIFNINVRLGEEPWLTLLSFKCESIKNDEGSLQDKLSYTFQSAFHCRVTTKTEDVLPHFGKSRPARIAKQNTRQELASVQKIKSVKIRKTEKSKHAWIKGQKKSTS